MESDVPDNQAVNALRQMLHEKEHEKLVKRPNVDEYMRVFVAAVRETDPDMTFSVVDIRRWATVYAATKEEDVPEEIINTYSLGKYIKGRQAQFGLIDLGTYGNRQIYGIDTRTVGGA